MKKLIASLSLLGLLALVSCGQDKKSSELAGLRRFSIGVEFGKTKFKPSWKGMYESTDSKKFKFDKRETTFIASFIYRPNDKIFMSLDYISLGGTSLGGPIYSESTNNIFGGKFKYKGQEYSFDEGGVDGTYTQGLLKINFSGLGLGFGFIYPFAKKFYGGVKAGLFFWDRKAKITGAIQRGAVNSGVPDQAEKSVGLVTKGAFENDDSDLYYSFMLGYKFDERFNLYGSYNSFNMESDKASSIDLGVNFRF